MLDLVQPALAGWWLGTGDNLEPDVAAAPPRRGTGISASGGANIEASGECQAGRGVLSYMNEPASGLSAELPEELRLIEDETGIARDPRAPVVGYVRAAATTGNPRAQRLLARLEPRLQCRRLAEGKMPHRGARPSDPRALPTSGSARQQDCDATSPHGLLRSRRERPWPDGQPKKGLADTAGLRPRRGAPRLLPLRSRCLIIPARGLAFAPQINGSLRPATFALQRPVERWAFVSGKGQDTP